MAAATNDYGYAVLRKKRDGPFHEPENRKIAGVRNRQSCDFLGRATHRRVFPVARHSDIRRGVTGTQRLTPTYTSFVVPTQPDRLEVVRTYFAFGVEHILRDGRAEHVDAIN